MDKSEKSPGNRWKEKRLARTGKARALLARLSLEEKIRLMSGRTSQEGMIQAIRDGGHYNEAPYPAGGNDRLGIPPVMFCDGPRGVVCGAGTSTCFPVTVCRGATFDTALEEEIGRAIGHEVRAYGGNLFAGVCVNLPHNPGWGRSQESYGEDSFALGAMGAALVRGVQSVHVMACVKHYAFNSMETSRFKVSVDCDRRTEREVFLPHFKDCIDAGAAAVMSAYNRYKGTLCGQHDYLLRKILKEEWGFDGFVMSDFFWGIDSAAEAANCGQDMEMCCADLFGEPLVRAVRGGLVAEERIDGAALRIIRTVIAFQEEREKAESRNTGKAAPRPGCKKHRDLALRAAREGIVLLQNRNRVLPLDAGRIKKLALIGRLGDRDNLGDHGSSRVYPAGHVTILEGLRKAAPDTEIVFYQGGSIEYAKELAASADAAVFAAGLDYRDEGEYVSSEEGSNYMDSIGGDRAGGLSLRGEEIEMIRNAGPANRNSIVVLIGGGTIVLDGWNGAAAAILMAWYPGQEGGTAVGEILFGKTNPGGKLPFVIPRREEDLPAVRWDTKNQWYDYYHGYAKLEKEGKEPFLPYGFGLSYTTFRMKKVRFSFDGGDITASCTLRNTGKRAGDEVLQLYAGFKNSTRDRPVKKLCGFVRVSLAAGEEKQASITCPVEKLRFYDTRTGRFELERMDHELYLGTSSAAGDLIAGTISL